MGNVKKPHICKKCKHHSVRYKFPLTFIHICRAPLVGPVDIVTGVKIKHIVEKPCIEKRGGAAKCPDYEGKSRYTYYDGF